MNGRWNCFCMSTDCRFVRRFCLNCSVASAVNIVTDPKRVETCLSSGTTVLLDSRIGEGSELLIASRGCMRSIPLDVVRPLPSRATRGRSHGLLRGWNVTSFVFTHSGSGRERETTTLRSMTSMRIAMLCCDHPCASRWPPPLASRRVAKEFASG